MASTTFTNASDYGPDDYLTSAVNITGITVADVTNMRFELDWNPNFSDSDDEDCGGDASSSVCVIANPDGGTFTMFAYGSKSGTIARTDTFDKTSSFPTNFNGNWTFQLTDDDAMGCNSILETRIIVTYSTGATGSPAFLMFVD